MKKAMSTLIILSSFISASAFAAVSSGGERIMPLLTLKHTGGFVAPAYRDRLCQIFPTQVAVFSADQLILQKPVTYTDQIPNAEALSQLLDEAKTGQVVPTEGANPDVGSSEYFAFEGSQKVLLKKSAFMEGLKNDSSATPSLIEFVNANCN